MNTLVWSREGNDKESYRRKNIKNNRENSEARNVQMFRKPRTSCQGLISVFSSKTGRKSEKDS